MLKKLMRGYFAIPMIARILSAFVLGTVLGLICSKLPETTTGPILAFAQPLGGVLISLLKMVVFPIVFFSLVLGAAALPLKKSGKLGASVMLWYLLTSVFATLFGIVLATALDPTMESFAETAAQYSAGAESLKSGGGAENFGAFFVGLFRNPFESLATGQFLPIVVFSIVFGLAARVLLDSTQTHENERRAVDALLTFCDGARVVSFKIVDWALEYFPIGILALTFTNFTTSGSALFGPYLQIVLCVAAGVLGMIFVVYPLAIVAFCHENPYRVLAKFRAPILTAFATRSSAATLSVSMKAAEKEGVSSSLSSFSLPLGCTINMDGVCVHLPVFVILAANVFGVTLTPTSLLVLLTSVVFASIGAGGVPGGSVFLLFMILENAGFSPEQVAAVVALALGVNPILDMFETACNVAGDNVCTYIVAKRNGMIERK